MKKIHKIIIIPFVCTLRGDLLKKETTTFVVRK